MLFYVAELVPFSGDVCACEVGFDEALVRAELVRVGEVEGTRGQIIGQAQLACPRLQQREVSDTAKPPEVEVAGACECGMQVLSRGVERPCLPVRDPQVAECECLEVGGRGPPERVGGIDRLVAAQDLER